MSKLAKPTLDEIKLLNMRHLLNNMLARPGTSPEKIAEVEGDIERLKAESTKGELK